MPGDEHSRSPTREALDWAAMADEALEEARNLPPGDDRALALKKAGSYRNNADHYGIKFATKGRPRNDRCFPPR